MEVALLLAGNDVGYYMNGNGFGFFPWVVAFGLNQALLSVGDDALL